MFESIARPSWGEADSEVTSLGSEEPLIFARSFCIEKPGAECRPAPILADFRGFEQSDALARQMQRRLVPPKTTALEQSSEYLILKGFEYVHNS